MRPFSNKEENPPTSANGPTTKKKEVVVCSRLFEEFLFGNLEAETMYIFGVGIPFKPCNMILLLSYLIIKGNLTMNEIGSFGLIFNQTFQVMFSYPDSNCSRKRKDSGYSGYVSNMEGGCPSAGHNGKTQNFGSLKRLQNVQH